MNTFRAIMIADGGEEAGEEETLQAWQHLLDTGVGLSLGGHFADTIRQMVEAGQITDKRTRH